MASDGQIASLIKNAECAVGEICYDDWDEMTDRALHALVKGDT